MKDYKLKQRNLRASHTLGYYVETGKADTAFFFPPRFPDVLKNFFHYYRRWEIEYIERDAELVFQRRELVFSFALACAYI